VDFSEAMDLFGNIFQIPGPNCKIMDCGFISKKPRGLFAKFPKKLIFGFNFQREIPWTESIVRWTVDRAGARWTADRGHGGASPARGARALELASDGGGG
jgi:hypothetical protein